MDELTKDTALLIENSIRDLFANKDLYPLIDINEAINVVQDFVFSNSNAQFTNDDNRYEYYYKMIGMAVAIVQGWKVNCAADVKWPSQTRANLIQYIENTYGKNKIGGVKKINRATG